jgi:hypothetical protein
VFEKYLKLLNENLDWVKKQLKEDKYMKNLKLARQVCNAHKYRVVGMLELMQEIEEITWEKAFEERKKVDELFELENLLGEIEKNKS